MLCKCKWQEDFKCKCNLDAFICQRLMAQQKIYALYILFRILIGSVAYGGFHSQGKLSANCSSKWKNVLLLPDHWKSCCRLKTKSNETRTRTTTTKKHHNWNYFHSISISPWSNLFLYFSILDAFVSHQFGHFFKKYSTCIFICYTYIYYNELSYICILFIIGYLDYTILFVI